MTLTCDLDMVDLWVLHIDSLRRTFDQSLMKIFQRIQEIWSGQESVTEGQTDRWMDRWTDEGHFYNLQSASRWEINKCSDTLCFTKIIYALAEVLKNLHTHCERNIVYADSKSHFCQVCHPILLLIIKIC